MKAALVFTLLFLFPPRGLLAQTPPPAVFPASAERVAVDVSVVDGKGNPVLGLGPEDFTVTLDGKPRPVVSLEYVAFPSAPSSPPPSLPAAFSTNVGVARGRLVILAVDQGNIRVGGGRAVVAAANRLLDRLGPSDRVGLITFPGPGPHVELTGEVDKVRKALGSVVGRGQLTGKRVNVTDALALSEGDEATWRVAEERECPPTMTEKDRMECVSDLTAEALQIANVARTQSNNSLKTLKTLLAALEPIEGPKTVILVSEGLLGEDAPLVRQAAAAAAAARVVLFGIRVDPGMPDASVARAIVGDDQDRFARDAGFEKLVYLARGAVFRPGGSGDAVFDRIARELSGYYLLGVAPEPGDRDDRVHDVRVTLTRPGLTIRARRVVQLPRAAPDAEALLLGLLRSPFLATDLPLRVTTYSLPEPRGSKVRLLIAGELAEGAAAVDPAAAFSVVDAKEHVVAASKGGRFTAGPEGGPGTYVATALLDPGRYTLRLAVRDARGREGSVDHPFAAVLGAAGKLAFGDLVLAEVPPAGAALQPLVDGRAGGSILLAQLQLSAPEASRFQEARVRVEVAESEAGPALFTVPATLAGEDADRRAARAVLPISLLPPGTYVSRAVISTSGQDYGPVRRAFEVPPASSARPLALAGWGHARPAFSPAAVLAADVVGHFLDRAEKIAGAPTAPAVREAWSRVRAGQLQPALEALGSTSADPVAAAFVRGLALLGRAQPDAASAQFRRAIEGSSELLPAAVYLGACAAATGHDREAVGAWQTALVAETDTPVVYQLLADALLRLDDLDGAVSILREATAAWPRDAALMARLGLALAGKGERAEALRVLSAVLDGGSTDGDALFAALRLLFEAHAAGTATAEDSARLDRYAAAYAATGGPLEELVALWERRLHRAAR